MLDFFRRYQRYFFFVISVMVISSFLFFGTYSTFSRGDERPDWKVSESVSGSSIMLSDVQKLTRFVLLDRLDPIANLCNDGVIRQDFLHGRIGELLVTEYFDALQPDLAARLERAKRYRPYEHPEASFISAKAIWGQFVPELTVQLGELQRQLHSSPETFVSLAKLYSTQAKLPPEMLRRLLVYQHRQQSWVKPDPRLSSDDLSLFGFHTVSDWFGQNFVDLVSQFILNTASVAEQKGYKVSLEEAKGDLIRIFQESVAMRRDQKESNFYNHLRYLGFDEKSASQVWRKVLLFRKYLSDVGQSVFIDTLACRDLACAEDEVAVVETYRWPLKVKTAQDLAELEWYLKAVGLGKGVLPITHFLSVEEVAQKYPELVESTYKARIAEVSKMEVGLKATLKQVWQWEIEDAHWELLKKRFHLADAKGQEERFQILDELSLQARHEIDTFVRGKLVDENPAWIEEALLSASWKEKTWTVLGNQDPSYQNEGSYFRVEEVEQIKPPHILPFAKVRPFLAKKVGEVKGNVLPEKNPFWKMGLEAMSALKAGQECAKWMQANDPLVDQFRLERMEESLADTSNLALQENGWSALHAAENGEISFSHFLKTQHNEEGFQKRLNLGKEALAIDAKVFVAERLLQTVKERQAIVLPLLQPKEDQ